MKRILMMGATALLALLGLGAVDDAVAGGSGKPDTVSYFGRTDGAKLRLATKGDLLTNSVFHGKKVVCRDDNGDLAEPWYGPGGVTSGFNDTKLEKSGEFVAHDAYKHPPGLVRNLSGDITTGKATVKIRFKAQTERDGAYDVLCRTGPVEFDLHRVR